jgi:hypothetical protein
MTARPSIVGMTTFRALLHGGNTLVYNLTVVGAKPNRGVQPAVISV